MLVAESGHPRADVRFGQLAIAAGRGQELDTGDRLRGTPLVDVGVRALSADDRLPGAAQAAHREHVGARSVKDEQRLGTWTEVPAQDLLRAAGPGITAIGDCMPLISLRHGGEHLRVNSGVVIRSETLHGQQAEKETTDAAVIMRG